MMLIVHRITGGALYIGTILLALWLVAAAIHPARPMMTRSAVIGTGRAGSSLTGCLRAPLPSGRCAVD